MKLRQWLRHELLEVGSVTLFFLVGFAFIFLLLQLMLGSHGVEFPALSKAVLAALILGKVVVVLGKLPALNLLSGRPAWMGVAWRTGVYVVGTAVVLVLETLWHLAGETGSWGAAWSEFLATRDARLVLAKLILVGGLILAHEAIREIGGVLGPGGLRRVFLATRADGEAAGDD